MARPSELTSYWLPQPQSPSGIGPVEACKWGIGQVQLADAPHVALAVSGADVGLFDMAAGLQAGVLGVELVELEPTCQVCRQHSLHNPHHLSGKMPLWSLA